MTAKERRTKWMTRRVVRKLCQRCSEPIGKDGTAIYCKACARLKSEQMNARNAGRRAEGLCNACPNESATYKCEPCQEKNRQARKRMRARRRDWGQCIVCRNDAKRFTRCTDCRLAHAEQRRRQRQQATA
jgi:hypothetical protein